VKRGSGLTTAFFLLISLVGAAQEVRVAGTWDITLETGQGTANPSMTLAQDGEKITGTYRGRLGESKLEGTLKGSAIQFSVTLKFQDQPMTVSYRGTVDGDTMKGTVQFGDRGSGSWTAKRRS
jgi:hypothetical protein